MVHLISDVYVWQSKGERHVRKDSFVSHIIVILCIKISKNCKIFIFCLWTRTKSFSVKLFFCMLFFIVHFFVCVKLYHPTRATSLQSGLPHTWTTSTKEFKYNSRVQPTWACKENKYLTIQCLAPFIHINTSTWKIKNYFGLAWTKISKTKTNLLWPLNHCNKSMSAFRAFLYMIIHI